MEEKDFYNESEQRFKAPLNCPHCKQVAEYELRWAVRKKKDSLPGRADERDRAKFAKFKSYMVRKDDFVTCSNPRCRKKVEVSGIQSVVEM
jgi:hypothetical protein